MVRNKKGNKPKKKSGRKKKASTVKKVAQVAGRVARGFLAGATGIPFEVSGCSAMATPAANLGQIQVSAPQANGLVSKTSSARMRSGADGTVRVTHREYITDIISNGTTAGQFQLLVAHSINPGNPLLFPWLAEIARRFESFKFHGLKFVYEPQCPTTTSGTVMMVIDYDESDSPPQNKTQMMAYKNAVRSPPWFACANVSSVSDLAKRATYYVQNSAQTGAQDSRLDNVGEFYLAMETSTTTSFYAGELYVEYDVVLMTPNLEQDSLSGSLQSLTGALSGIIPPAVTNIGQGPNNPIVFYSSSTPNSFYISPSVPGLHFVFVFASASAVTGPNALKFQVSPGSNAVLGSAQYGTNTTATSGNDTYIFASIVEFPNVTDSIQVSMTAGSTNQLGSIIGLQLTVYLFASASGLLGVPPGNVVVAPELGPLRQLTQALSRLEIAAQDQGQRRVKVKYLPHEKENSFQTDVRQKSATSGLADRPLPDLEDLDQLTIDRPVCCKHCIHDH